MILLNPPTVCHPTAKDNDNNTSCIVFSQHYTSKQQWLTGNSLHSTFRKQCRIKLQHVILKEFTSNFRIEIRLISHQLCTSHGTKTVCSATRNITIHKVGEKWVNHEPNIKADDIKIQQEKPVFKEGRRNTEVCNKY